MQFRLGLNRKGDTIGTLIASFVRDESGATAIEYALIGLLISVAIVAGATKLGAELLENFTSMSRKIPGID